MLPAAGVDVEAELVSPVDGGQDDSVEHCACRPLSFVDRSSSTPLRLLNARRRQ